MILQPYSYNGTLLQSTDYETSIPRSSALAQLEANLSYVRRTGAQPIYAGKEYQPVTLNLEIKMLHDFMTTLENLNQLFNVMDDTPRQFIIKDTEDSSKQYYVYATPKRVLGGHDGQMAVVTLGFDDAIWQTVTQSSQVWSITASGQSTDVVVGGNIEVYPSLTINMSSGFGYKRYVEYIPMSAYAWNNRPVELANTAGIGIDTAALVAANKVQSSGNDFRVFLDGVEIPRWFGGLGFNTTDTKVWVNLYQPPTRQFTLRTALASTDDTVVEFTYTAADAVDFAALPAQGRIKIDSEEITYTSKLATTTRLRVYGITRGVRNTTAAAHSAAAVVYWVPYDITFFYGSSDMAAPDIDNSYQPIITLTTSSNSSFVYGSFLDDDNLQSGNWIKYIQSVSSLTESQTDVYTGVNDGGDTNPADVAGMKVPAYQSGGVWKPETSTLFWRAYFPDGISSMSASYERYQYNASTPASKLIQTSVNSAAWVTGYTFASVSATDYAAWVTGSLASTDITVTTNARFVRLIMAGTVTGVANNVTKLGLTTATIGLTNAPTTALRSEQTNGYLDATFTVGSYNMRIVYPLKSGDTMTVDTSPDFPYASINGQYINGAVFVDSVRSKWLPFSPGTNTITYTSSYTGAMTVTIYWRDRMNYL